MAHKKAPLSGRDLIRYLPDLLTGKEPVFDDPAVQRFITQDPEGRAAVGLIADTAAALTVAHDRVATQTYAAIKPLRESVLAAKKYAKRQLADLLFYEGMRRWQAAKHRQNILVSFDYQTDPFEGRLPDTKDMDQLAYIANAPTAATKNLCLPSSSSTDRLDPKDIAQGALQCFTSDATLVPGREGTQFMRMSCELETHGRRGRPKRWLVAAATFHAIEAIACSMDRALELLIEDQSVDLMAELAISIESMHCSDPIVNCRALIASIICGNRSVTDALSERVRDVMITNTLSMTAVDSLVTVAVSSSIPRSILRSRSYKETVLSLPEPLSGLSWSPGT